MKKNINISLNGISPVIIIEIASESIEELHFAILDICSLYKSKQKESMGLINLRNETLVGILSLCNFLQCNPPLSTKTAKYCFLILPKSVLLSV